MFSDEKRGNPLSSAQIPSFSSCLKHFISKHFAKKRGNQLTRGKLASLCNVLVFKILILHNEPVNNKSWEFSNNLCMFNIGMKKTNIIDLVCWLFTTTTNNLIKVVIIWLEIRMILSCFWHIQEISVIWYKCYLFVSCLWYTRYPDTPKYIYWISLTLFRKYYIEIRTYSSENKMKKQRKK